MAKWLAIGALAVIVALGVAWVTSPDPRGNVASFEAEELTMQIAPLEVAITLAQVRRADDAIATLLVVGLEDDEINMILAWVDQGAPIGNKDSIPAPPEYPNASQLGEPDMTIKMTEPYHIIGNNTDQFMVVKIPYELEADTFLSAVEFVPDNR